MTNSDSFEDEYWEQSAKDLVRAATYGNVNRVRAFLAVGVDTTGVDEFGQTALIAAACSSKERSKAMVEALLEANSPINHQDKDGYTALMVAARQGNKDVVEMLLKRGAEIGIENKQHDTALTIAERYGNNEIVKILEEAKEKVNAEQKKASLKNAIKKAEVKGYGEKSATSDIAKALRSGNQGM